MMKFYEKTVCLVLGGLLSFSAVSCGKTDPKKNKSNEYTPRFSTDYDANRNSWTQVDPGDEDITIHWFFDYAVADENLEDLIYQRTGVNVVFESASTSDHTEINAMIAGDNLPDVITLNDTSLRILLAEEGYCYPLNKLAQFYAPGMVGSVPVDHWEHYRGSDGNTYALSSNFYSDSDIAEMSDLGMHEYASRDIMVRKDYLDEYIAYKKSENPDFDENATVTKPSGFLDMCLWVKDNHGYTIANPTVCFDPFYMAGDELSYSITALYEAFGFSPEDKDGNLVYTYASDEFKDAVSFMHQMYENGLVSSQNFGWDASYVGSEVLKGHPFCVIGGSQLTHFQQAKREKDGYDLSTNTVPDDHSYVTVLLTNENGDAPCLSSYNRKGVYQTMITKNCEREDRVIKVLDYLLSEQGQREAMYGSTDNYEFTVRPGETDPITGKKSTYGIIASTDTLKEKLPAMFQTGSQPLGIRRTSPFANAAYGRMVSREDDFIGIRHPVDWVLYQNKKTYFGYTYNYADFDFSFENISRKELNLYATRQADVFAVWAEALPAIIMAKGNTNFENLFAAALAESYEMGANEWMETRNLMFKNYKNGRNMQFAYPKNRADYVAPTVKLTGGLFETIARPEYVYETVKQ